MFGDLLTPMHLFFVLIIVLIIFGPKRLPEIGRSLGKGIHEFKKSTSEIQEHMNVSEEKKTEPTEKAESVRGPQEEVTEKNSQSPPAVAKP